MSIISNLKVLVPTELDRMLEELDGANEDIIDTVIKNYYEKLDNSTESEHNKSGLNFNFRR